MYIYGKLKIDWKIVNRIVNLKLASWINICVYKVHLDAQLDLPSQINLMGKLAVSKILNLTSWPSMCCVFKKKKVAQTKDTLVSLWYF